MKLVHINVSQGHLRSDERMGEEDVTIRLVLERQSTELLELIDEQDMQQLRARQPAIMRELHRRELAARAHRGRR